MKKYMSLTIRDVGGEFYIKKLNNGLTELALGRARPIYIKFPLKLDENLAKICAMLLDGSLDKNFTNVMFCQRKDKNKLIEATKIIKNYFGITPKSYRFDMITFSNKTLSYFFHKYLSMHKCDYEANIPNWIKKSPPSVTKEYIRYAFAMEGSVKDPSFGSKDVRFHSCDLSFILDLKKFIKQKYNINFRFFKYYIKNYGYKYYIHINDAKNIKKFIKIGSALYSHEQRLNNTLGRIKNKAWEITLVKLYEENKYNFNLKDISYLFPYIKSRAIYYRLKNLVNKKYLIYNFKNKEYNLTEYGKNKYATLKDKIRVSILRTNPRENENKILIILSSGPMWRNEIARKLNINCNTIRDTIKRLENQNKIRLFYVDKFQRKFYTLNKKMDI